MFALLVFGALAFTAVMVVGVLASVVGLLGFLISLPFRLLGLMFKVLGLIFALPFILLAVVLGGGAALIGLTVALLPLLPMVAFVALIWWLLNRGSNDDKASHASVIS